MENFQSLGLPEPLFNALNAMQYITPTPIQAQTISHALQGTDILGTAQTGTGKTAAYAIPLVFHLLNSDHNAALVLTPTRELATQVLALVEKLLDRKGDIRTALIIGGDSMGKQLNQLRTRPRIIVGTPGRINDHLERGTLKLNKTDFFVLDETDRMLDMGFGIQLETIAKFLPEKRQTLMFSATLPNNIKNIADKYLKNAIRVSVGSTIAVADTVKQEIVRTSEGEKYGVLLAQLEAKDGTIIVFVKTKIGAEKLATKLSDHGHSVAAIHGDLRQRNREQVIRGFRNRKHRILVATDVAARGLDISHVSCVINHDLPQCEEDFIHRVGRTGRAGAEGIAVSLITPQDHSKWRDISKMMNPGVKLDSSFDDPKNTRKPSNNRRNGEFRKPRSFAGNSENSFSFSGKPRSFGRDENSNRPAFGDKPRSFGRRDENSNRPAFGDKPRGFGRRDENSSRPAFGDKPRSFGRTDENANRPAFGDKPRSFVRRDENSSRPAFGDKPKSFGRRDENSNRPAFGDKPRSFGRRDENSSRPAFGDKPRTFEKRDENSKSGAHNARFDLKTSSFSSPRRDRSSPSRKFN